MFSFKRSPIVIVGLLVLIGTPLVSRGQGDIKNPLNRDPRKSFYLTQTGHTGSQALTACAEGYHMASLWEIFDTSNLRYNTVLGFNNADSGFGPPTNTFAWIRTGLVATASSSPGGGNCNAWTSASSMDNGTLVALPVVWDFANVTVISPWNSVTTGCSFPLRVWCMQD